MARKRKNSSQTAHPAPTAPPSSTSLPPNAPAALRRTRLFHLSLLILLSFALYAPTLRNDFVTDDKLQILMNPLVLEGKNLDEAFTTDVWSFAHQGRQNARFGSNYYRPLQMLVYAGEYHFFGKNPAAWHLVNILLNAAVVSVVYLLVASLATPTLAFWSALLFAFHPVHAEPVAWIAALPELQCALYLLLAMLFYHRARISSTLLPSLSLSTLFFLAALLSKETAMLFPLILLCYEFLFARTGSSEIVSVSKRIAPFLAVLAVYLVARIHALGGFAPFPSLDRPQLPFRDLFLAVPPIFARYIGKLLVPTQLQYFYSFPVTTAFTAWAAAGIASALLIAAAAFHFRKSQPLLAFAFCWFALTLAPALSINSLATNFFTERYLYIPSLGFTILAASAFLALFSMLRAPSWRVVPAAALASIFVFYAVQLQRRLPVFRDNFTLLSDTVRYSPNSYQIQSQLAATYYDRGDLDRALQHALIALELNPGYEIGQMNAAWYFTDKKNYDAAITHLQAAIRLYPDYPPPWINLARVYLLQHNWPLARETYGHLIEIDPEEAPVFRKFIAFAEANEKSSIPAVSGNSSPVQLPADFNALVRIGDSASQARQWQSAAQAFERASALQPDNSAILDKWGISLQASGDPAKAADVLQRAVQHQPDSLYIRQALAGALAGANRLADSNAQLHKILLTNAAWEHADQVHLALAVNAEKSNDRPTAIQEYRQALALNPSLDYATKRLAALK